MTSFVETFEAPHLGMDTESAPHRLAKGYARNIVNLLTGKPGRLPLRGCMNIVSSAIWSPSPAASGVVWASGTGQTLYARDTGGSTTLKQIAGNWAVLTTVTAPSVDAIPDKLHAPVGQYVYGFGGTGKFIRWTSGGTPSVVVHANAPTLASDIIYWLNRLWVLGGTAPGAAVVNSDRLYWSDLNDGSAALPDTLAAWQDDVSGLTNQLVLASISAQNTPVGLGRLNNALVVFGSHSGDMLVGSSPSNLSVRGGAVTHGCLDRDSIVEWNGGLVWVAPEGVFYFDGAQEIELSTSIRSELQARLKTATQAQAVRLPNDYMLFKIDYATTAPVYFLLHVPTRAWSRIVLPPGGARPRIAQVDAILDNDPRGARAVYFDGLVVRRLDELTRPDPVEHGSKDAALGGGRTPFTASCDTRLSLLGTPSSKAVVPRISATAIMTWVSGEYDGSYDGWQVMPRDATDADLLAASLPLGQTFQPLQPFPLPAGSYVPTLHTIHEPNIETNQLYFHMTFDTGQFNADVVELHDVYVEYDIAQKPASF